MVVKGQVTLKEISQRLGLGVSTVSEVLNNKSIRCKPTTRQRILELADELNYRPNIAAKSLTSQKTNTIGLVASSLSLGLNEIEQVCWDAGYTMSVTATHLDLDKQSEILMQLRQKYVDGTILIDPLPECQVINELQHDSYPVVIVSESIDYKDVDTFLMNIKGGVELAVKHLVQLGHRRIAATFSPSQWAFGTLRDQGWREGLKEELGIEPEDEWYIPLTTAKPKGGVYSIAYDAAEEFTRRFKKNDARRPTALYTSVDEVAVGAIRAFHDAGWRVPEDISVIGMMALELGRYCQPPVTSVDIEHRECRTQAIKHLLKVVCGEQGDPRPVVERFGIRLVKRDSTCEPPF
ncbi:MAG: LacI family DNA-binding transcriptional regulator [Planctomycetota bacterium]